MSDEVDEIHLLQSDSEPSSPRTVADPKPVQSDTLHEDFYYDRKPDRGNLRVSTLYYPGRPE